jgi:hypothetical protein
MKRAFVSLLVSLVIIPAIEAQQVPDEILRSSLALIGKAQRIRVNAAIVNDEVIATGQKLQRSYETVLKVRRPNGLRIDNNADRYRRLIQYDGKSLTVFDPEKGLYASFEAPPTLDAMTAMARETFGLDLPLSHLFAADAYAALSAKQRVGTYVGLHRIGATRCHHLAFSQDNVDWQIWIAADGPALPRKIVIDFKNRPGRPQYMALLSDWNLDAKFSDAEFQFAPPANAQKIEFLRTQGGPQ